MFLSNPVLFVVKTDGKFTLLYKIGLLAIEKKHHELYDLFGMLQNDSLSTEFKNNSAFYDANFHLTISTVNFDS